MTSTQKEIVATYHGIEVPDAPHLGSTMINNMNEGSYERREVQSALNFIKKGDRVVEMGAGAGVVGAIAAKNCAPAKIVSFEANHKLIPHVKALYKHNKIQSKIEVRNKIVLSDPTPPKTVEFFIQGGAGLWRERNPRSGPRREGVSDGHNLGRNKKEGQTDRAADEYRRGRA